MRVVQVNRVLKRVAQKGLSQASSQDVGRLAEAVWYGNTVPDRLCCINPLRSELPQTPDGFMQRARSPAYQAA